MNKRPELLWKKESTNHTAFFVDIFDGVRSMYVYEGIHEENMNHKFTCLPKKDNKLSIKYREQGNRYYIQKNFNKAMEMFHKGLCYAEINSVHISFAFGNRSLCLFDKQRYEDSLINIQLAKDANYPEELMFKLDNRKAKCLENIEPKNSAKSPNLPKLSLEADIQIPNMASVLEVKHNHQYGRHIITNSDIVVNQTVLIETPLSDVLIGSEYLRCSHCLKENMNFIACKKCVSAMFCDEICANNPYHRYECDLYKLFGWEDDGCFRKLLQSIVRLVLMGVTLTSTLNVDELMQLVAGCTGVDETTEIAIAEDSFRSKIETLLKLSCFIPTEKELYEGSIQVACLAYDLLLELTEIRRIFSTVAYQRFLMHLTVHFAGSFNTNRLTLADINSFGESVDYYGQAIFNIRSFLNHACVPNVVCLSYDNILVCKTIKPIKKGEQLFIDYIENDLKEERKTVRRGRLKDMYGFLCGCDLCLMSSETWASNVLMKSDSNFVYIKQNFDVAIVTRNQNTLNVMKEKSIAFLKKWGRAQPCEEFLIIQKYFSTLLQLLRRHDS